MCFGAMESFLCFKSCSYLVFQRCWQTSIHSHLSLLKWCGMILEQGFLTDFLFIIRMCGLHRLYYLAALNQWGINPADLVCESNSRSVRLSSSSFAWRWCGLN